MPMIELSKIYNYKEEELKKMARKDLHGLVNKLNDLYKGDTYYYDFDDEKMKTKDELIGVLLGCQ